MARPEKRGRRLGGEGRGLGHSSYKVIDYLEGRMTREGNKGYGRWRRPTLERECGEGVVDVWRSLGGKGGGKVAGAWFMWQRD
jgi:hypothetical protein